MLPICLWLGLNHCRGSPLTVEATPSGEDTHPRNGSRCHAPPLDPLNPSAPFQPRRALPLPEPGDHSHAVLRGEAAGGMRGVHARLRELKHHLQPHHANWPPGYSRLPRQSCTATRPAPPEKTAPCAPPEACEESRPAACRRPRRWQRGSGRSSTSAPRAIRARPRNCSHGHPAALGYRPHPCRVASRAGRNSSQLPCRLLLPKPRRGSSCRFGRSFKLWIHHRHADPTRGPHR